MCKTFNTHVLQIILSSTLTPEYLPQVRVFFISSLYMYNPQSSVTLKVEEEKNCIFKLDFW